MNENEIWRDIEGYEGLYQVSNLGKVKSLKYGKEKILKQAKDRDGYLQVNLYKDRIRKTFYVHRLVVNAFIPNPNNLPTVNHIDENKENNVVENLEWMDMKQQVNHGTCQQRRVVHTDYKAIADKIDWVKKVENTDYKSIGRKNAEKLSRQVYQYKLDGTLVAIWNSTAECGRQDYNQGHVAECCRGERKSHRGYIWSYYPL